MRWLISILLLSLPSIFSLLKPGFFTSDDGEWMIIRFSAFHQTLVDGQFPVRFLGRLNQEYGYPVANFLYPGFMYLAEIPKILGFSYGDSIKIILGLSMMASGIFTYLWLGKNFGKLPALIGALFYVYSPYHLYDLYKRGSVGEVLALAILPFILWSIERKSFLASSIGIAMLILSHNTLAFLFLPIIAIYMFLRKLSTFKFQLSTLLLGLALSVFFWIPALYDLQYTRFFETTVSNWEDHFASIEVVGIATFIVLLLVVIAKKYKANTVLFFIVALFSVFLSLSISAPLWKILPVSFIQFPFRFLSLTLISVAYLVSYAAQESKYKFIIATLLIVFLVFSSAPFIKPQEFVLREEGFYTTNMDTTTVKNEYMPKWVKVDPVEKATQKVEIIQGIGKLDNLIAKNNQITFTTNMEREGVVRINTVYFPGWDAFINGKKTKINYENELGAMEVNMPEGKHEALLRFGEPQVPIRLASDLISLIGLICLISFAQIKRKI